MPDYLTDCEKWLLWNNAVDIEDGHIVGGPINVSTIVMRAIGWLIDEKRKIHPLDNMHIESYIKDAANVINHFGGACGYDDIIRHCIERGLNMSEATTVANIFTKVPKKGYHMSPTANFNFLIQWIDDSKYESIKA